MTPSDRDVEPPSRLARRIKEQAAALGFDLVGIAPAVAPMGFGSFLDWLERGHDAGMEYMRRHAEARAHPGNVLEGVRSVVMVGLSYKPAEPDPEPSPSTGKVARYARGRDYHKVLRKRLERLLDWLRAEVPGAEGRAVVDTAPLMERDYARLAGLGWIAKNTMLINPHVGSYTLLGALLTDLELEPDAPFEANHCGTCTRCLDACPTDAFAAPGVLDARRCISYWTIEHRGPLPDAVAENLDGWLFGCDVCQEVCPWNRKGPPGLDPDLRADPRRVAPDLLELLAFDEDAVASLINGSALTRAKRSGLLRNAAALLASRCEAEALPPLNALLDDVDPTVRDAASRAIDRIESVRPSPLDDPNRG